MELRVKISLFVLQIARIKENVRIQPSSYYSHELTELLEFKGRQELDRASGIQMGEEQQLLMMQMVALLEHRVPLMHKSKREQSTCGAQIVRFEP